MAGPTRRPARLAGGEVTRHVWFCMWWMGCAAYIFCTVPDGPTGAAQLRADGISSCCCKINVHNHPSWVGYPVFSKKVFCGRWNKTERNTVLSEFRLFGETKNLQNSVPSHSAEQKRYRNFVTNHSEASIFSGKTNLEKKFQHCSLNS